MKLKVYYWMRKLLKIKKEREVIVGMYQSFNLALTFTNSNGVSQTLIFNGFVIDDSENRNTDNNDNDNHNKSKHEINPL